MDTAARDALLTLTLTPGLGPTLTRRCLSTLGSAQSVLDAPIAQLEQVQGIGPKRAEEIRRQIDRLRAENAAEAEKQRMAALHVRALALDDPDYPPLLKLIHDPPPLLYCRGRLLPEDALALAIVGTRRCSAYGRQQADRFAALCAQAGLCIVSGGALGIDTAAHRAALRAGGRTIAVLGSGLANPYPPANKELFDSIATGSSQKHPRNFNNSLTDTPSIFDGSSPNAATDIQASEGKTSGAGGSGGASGAVVSELPMTTPPIPENFPSRNRIISGLALGVLVIEAPRRSGALITARLAAEDHNREVMAVPGRVDTPHCAGVHQAIREGWATLVTNAADVLDALGDAGQLLKATLEKKTAQTPDDIDAAHPAPSLFAAAHLTPPQQKIVAALTDPATLDQLVAITALPVPAIQAELTLLEIRGLIKRSDGTYRRRDTPNT